MNECLKNELENARRAEARSTASDIPDITGGWMDAVGKKRWLHHFSGAPGYWRENSYTLWERVESNGIGVRSTYLKLGNERLPLCLWWKECEPRQQISIYFRPDGTQCERAEYDIGYRIQCDTPLRTT